MMCSGNLKSAQARVKWLELFTKSNVDRVRLYILAKPKDLAILGAEHKTGTTEETGRGND